ncbi:hypothetical protein LJR225_000730 [Phenylobacterium sp. LjRoot225]|uniref:hypothetical protein n=1 Tax=Phenylobacterium sp. LjRoot225 TaxID=3342285 RepID=UPI003ECE07E2
MSIYSVFDSFLDSDTWFKGETSDNEGFFLALSQIVQDPGFSPQRMGDYIGARMQSKLDSQYLDGTIHRLAGYAEVVHGYLKAVGGL